jgi:hypothetical protein
VNERDDPDTRKTKMTLHPAHHPARIAFMLLFAAFAAILVWMFLPGGDSNWTPPRRAAAFAARRWGCECATADTSKLDVPLAVRGEDGIRLMDDGKVHASTVMGEGASSVVPAVYAVTWLDGNGDETLDPGEHAILHVELAPNTTVHPGNPLDLIVRPVDSAPLTIEGVLE